MDLQTPQPYTQWGLPSGAIARLGKGAIGSIRYSPDGTQLAVTCSMGICYTMCTLVPKLPF